MKTEHIEIFDPRSGRIFAPQPSTDTRGADHWKDMLVIQARGADWSEYVTALDDALSVDGADAFVLFNPWWPGGRQRMTRFANAFEAVKRIGHARFAVMAGQPIVAERVLRLRRELGDDDSGLWILGTSSTSNQLFDALQPIAARHPPCSVAASVSHLFHGALCLDEQGWSNLFLRLAGGNEFRVDELLQALTQPEAN